MRELGIYIHIPFCKQKCYYCDFISFAKNDNKIDDYIETIKKEILQISKMVDHKDNIVTTIYIGGGTPSYINEKHIYKTFLRPIAFDKTGYKATTIIPIKIFIVCKTENPSAKFMMYWK